MVIMRVEGILNKLPWNFLISEIMFRKLDLIYISRSVITYFPSIPKYMSRFLYFCCVKNVLYILIFHWLWTNFKVICDNLYSACYKVEKIVLKKLPGKFLKSEIIFPKYDFLSASTFIFHPSPNYISHYL